MYKTLIVGALAFASIAAPAFAEQPSTPDQVLGQLESLSKRVDKLEQDNARLAAEKAELKERNDRLEATTDSLRASATATGKEPAAVETRVASLEKSAAAAEWTSRISWTGAFRYRHEQVQPEEAAAEQKRQRIRARIGLTAKLTDRLATTVQIATNGGSGDPRSTNQTLANGLTRKGLGLDLAYADWKPATGLTVQLGKTPYPWQRVGSYLWDPDLTWEGASVKLERGAFFGTAMGSWLSESSSVPEGTLFGAQFGMKGELGGVKLVAALNYFDVGALQGQITTLGTGCVPNDAFFLGPQGNTTFTDAGGCTHLQNDFNLIEAQAQADFKLGRFPLVFFADYLQNQDAPDLDTGFSLGFSVGKAADPHTWELGYAYQEVEKDAQFGQFVDSDFAGGITDTKGNVFKFGYVPAKSWIANAQYFQNDRFVDVGDQRAYDRWQLDLNYRF